MVHPISFLAVLIVNHGVTEIVHMTGGLPGGRVHKNCCINTHNIIRELGHTLPPVIPYILFELAAVLAIIINGTEAIVNFTGRKYESIFLTMGYNCLKF